MRIKRHYTKPGECPYSSIGFKKVKSELRSLDGIKCSNKIEFSVPENWSQVACDILAQKYLRKTGISSNKLLYLKFICLTYLTFKPIQFLELLPRKLLKHLKHQQSILACSND